MPWRRLQKAEKIAARNEAHLETLAFEDAPGRKVSAESQAKSAEKHLEELARVFEERKAEMTDDVRVEIEQRITEARAMFEKGNAALRGKNYEEAFRLFQDARSLAQKIAVLIKSHLTSGIDVKKRSGEPKPPIKVPGPVRPGPAPSLIENPARKETAERALHKAAALFEDIQELLEKNQSIFQDDVWGRIKNEMTAAENLISEGKRALEAKEYGTAYLAAQKAINLLYEVNQVVFKYTESSNTDTTKEVLDAREVALDALEKAKQAISSSGAPDEIIRKAKALYEEAQYVFSKGEHAEKNGDLKEAVELYRKTMRIVEEVIRVLGSVNIKPYPIEPAPTPVPKPVACTKEYAPVCGSVSAGIVCIKAPCPSTVEKTYGNACEARVAGAEVLYKGECRAKVSEEDDTKDETIAKCDYAAPPQGCSYVKGAAYNATTGCGLVLQCATTEIFPVKTEAAPVTNTTETKTDEVKTEAAKTDSSQYNTY
ncbi:MAG: hypothetical protein HYY60_01175 [Parcubacteria group bacterium]|nr:hypothetical protein [Parcubacteria group bacterium]